MKKLILLLSSIVMLILSKDGACQSPDNPKVKRIDFKFTADPPTNTQLRMWCDNTDSILKVLYPDGTIVPLSGASGTAAGGSNTQVQYNAAGFLAGDAGMVYNATTNKITVDSVQARYRIAAGSSTAQVLFNSTNVIVGDAGMVYNATNNKLTVDSLVFTGASIGNGTAANPTIYFTNSTGVGFYRSASNVLGIATAGTERVTIDAQGDINVAGGRGVNSVADSDMWATFMPTDAQQALTDTGAANVTSYYTALTTTVASPVTLASGTQIGQLKKIALVVDGGSDATLTLTGYTSIVFNDAGDYVVMLWNGSAWFVTENNGTTITP